MGGLMFNLFGGKGKKAQPSNLADASLTDTTGPFKGGFQPKPVPMDLNLPTDLPHSHHAPADPMGQPDFGSPAAMPPEQLDFDPHAAATGALPSTMQPDYLPSDDGAFSVSELPVADFTDAPFVLPVLDETHPNPSASTPLPQPADTSGDLFADSFDMPTSWSVNEPGALPEPMTNPFDGLAPADLNPVEINSLDTPDLTLGSDDWARQAAARLDAVGDALYPPETFDVGVNTETVRMDTPAVGGFGGEAVSWDDINDLKAIIPAPEANKFNWSGEESVTFTSSLKPEAIGYGLPEATGQSLPEATAQGLQQSAQQTLSQKTPVDVDPTPPTTINPPVLNDDFTFPSVAGNQPDPAMALFSPVQQDDLNLPTLDDAFNLTIAPPANDPLFSTPADAQVADNAVQMAPSFDMDPLNQADLFALPEDGFALPRPDDAVNVTPLDQPAYTPDSVIGLASLQQPVFEAQPLTTEQPFTDAASPQPFTARDVRDTVLLGEHCVHLVQQGQAYYLVCQQDEQWQVLKDLSSMGLKPSAGINVLLEGYAGGKEVYTVHIGTWKAILNADSQGVILHTEIS
jgi:hypothetical protein